MTQRKPAFVPSPVGLSRSPRHQYYWNAVGPMVNVTGAIGVIDKPGVFGWAKRETAACAVRNIGAVVSMIVEGGPDAAVDWLKRIPDYKRDKSADFGSGVHVIADRINKGEEGLTISAAEKPYVDAYRRALEDYDIEVLESEFMVANLRHWYGGTGDLIGRMVRRGRMATGLFDIKTGSDTYAETALQFAALRGGEFIGRPDDPTKYPLPPIDFCAVLHVRPDLYDKGYELIEYKVARADFTAFLNARRMHRWVHERAKLVKGSPLAISVLPQHVEEEVLAA